MFEKLRKLRISLEKCRVVDVHIRFSFHSHLYCCYSINTSQQTTMFSRNGFKLPNENYVKSVYVRTTLKMNSKLNLAEHLFS